MMRIAIAGGGGFAYLLAHAISQTANAVIVLSTTARPEFEQQLDCQTIRINFNDLENVRYALQGVDILISTICGEVQLILIDAARRARVRLFVPSEFEGPLNRRRTDDPLDGGSAAAMEQLQHWAQSRNHNMQYTVFSCGILYECFAPGGLATYGMGMGKGMPNQGDYLVDVGNASADIVELDSHGHPAQVSMTSVGDVAKFVAAAIELGPGNWPREFKMRGDRMSVRDIVSACSRVRGVPFTMQSRRYSELSRLLTSYQEAGDERSWLYVQRLRATADGRYDFGSPNLNEAVNQSDYVDVQPIDFREWLESQWGSG